MYVEKLTMKDFRCFEQAEVSFVYPGKEGLPDGVLDNVTLLMGINGTGKTSVLKAVALAQLSPVIAASGFFPRHLVRISSAASPEEAIVVTRFPEHEGEDWTSRFGPSIEGANHPGAAIRLVKVLDTELFAEYFWSADRFSMAGITFKPIPSTESAAKDRISREFYADDSPYYFMLGYGALRRVEYVESLDSQRSRRRLPRFQRVAGLFEDYITLYPLAAWYPTLESKPRQKEVRELLNGLLPESTSFTGKFKDADALFLHNGVKLPFGALSDGFRSYIGLVADMLYHLNYVCPKKSDLTDLSGVVMIDDIDVHLHPKWQREVVPKLATTFPKLQFIITSHSPLVAGTLHAANIRVIEDNQVHEYTERIHGLSADQILLSSYFGHTPPRSPDAVNKLNGIADRVADTGDPSAAIEFLNELAGKPNGHPAKKPKTAKKK